MNRKPITQARDPWLAGALPALRRARQRAEEVARDTGTSLVLAKDGKPVFVRPRTPVRGEPRNAR